MDGRSSTARLGATYEHGSLRLDRTLALPEGEHVEIIVVKRADATRWDLSRLGASPDEDREFAESGLGAWADDLDDADRR